MAKRDDFEAATERGRQLQAMSPRATAARYDRKNDRVVISLNNKLDVSFSPNDAQGLENAQPSRLEEIEISPSGFGIYFPRLDADLYVPAILEGILGSRKWMASRLGQVGGQSKSRAKKAAARANGKLGGRPKKTAGR